MMALPNPTWPPPGTLPAPPTRTTYAVLAALVGLFVVYGSFVPFNVQPLTGPRFSTGFEAFFAEEIRADSPADFVSNVALLVPFGFLLAGAFCLDSGRFAILFAAPLVLAGGLAVSLVAEIGQIFVPDRVASIADVFSQTCGNVIGVVAWGLAGQRSTGFVRTSLAHRQRTRLVTRLLVVYAVGLVIAEIQPLDLSIHPWELLRKYEEGRILLVPDAARLLTIGSLLDVLRFIPIGALCVMLWNRQGPHRSAPAAIAPGILAVAAIEVSQVFLYTRFADVLDILTGSIGVTLGVAVTRLLSPPGGKDASASRAVPAVLAVAWVTVLAIVNWSPLDVTWRPDIVHDRMMLLMAVPFSAYQSVPLTSALSEILRNGLLALPLGALLAMARPARAGLGAWSVTCLALSLGVLFLIETGQVLLPSRYPDVTDVILGVVGAAGARGSGAALGACPSNARHAPSRPW